MPRPKSQLSISPEKRAELVRLLRDAVSKEARFGIREDCRCELEAGWAALVDKLIEAARG